MMTRGRIPSRAALVLFGALVGALLSGMLFAVLSWYRLSPQERDVVLWEFLDGSFYRKDGQRFVANHPRMPFASFRVPKPAGMFRVFVVGGSAAMGEPYVHDMSALQGVDADLIPDYGGTPTWLQQYLQAIYPERTVEVVNAGMPGQNATTAARAVAEILAVGEPDLIIVWSGNNEANLANSMEQSTFDNDLAFEQAMQRLTENFADQIASIVRAVDRAQVTTYLLTVPVNLRDWFPAARFFTEDPRIVRDVIKLWFRIDTGTDVPGEIEAMIDDLERSGFGNHAATHYLRGVRALRIGFAEEAYGWFSVARDRDYRVNRARSDWNRIVRASASARAHPLDIEAAVAAASKDRIPGYDLFHDFCHMKLVGYMLVAREIAREHARRIGREAEFPEPELPEKLHRHLDALYRIKALKWGERGEVNRLYLFGDANRRNVSRYFEAERNDVPEIDMKLRLFELEMNDYTGGVHPERPTSR